MSHFFSFLASMRTAVWLLGVLALASATGTFFPQNLPHEVAVTVFGPFWAAVFSALSVFQVFEAWWFLGILLFLMASVSVCLLRNGPGIWGQFLRRVGTQKLNRLGYFFVHGGVILVAISGILSGIFGFRAILLLPENTRSSQAVEATSAGMLWHSLPFVVNNQSFTLETYPNGLPKQYRTEVSLVDKASGAVVKEATVSVNTPARYGLYSLYQSDFGDAGSTVSSSVVPIASIMPLTAADALFHQTLTIGEDIPLSTGGTVRLLALREDTPETVREENTPTTRTFNRGPSMDYLLTPPDGEAVALRSYLNYPDMVGVQLQSDTPFTPVFLGLNTQKHTHWAMLQHFIATHKKHWLQKEFPRAALQDFVKNYLSSHPLPEDVGLTVWALQTMQAALIVHQLKIPALLRMEAEYDIRYYSGLQVGFDPGAWLFALASFLLLAGLVLMVYFRKNLKEIERST